MLTSLSFLDTQLGIGLGNRCLESTLFRRHKKKTNISSSRSRNHILDVILMSRCVDNGIMILFGEELLGVTLNGNSTLTLFLTGVEVVGETEGRLAFLFRGGLEFVHFTLRDPALLEDQVTTGGGFAWLGEKKEMSCECIHIQANKIKYQWIVSL